MKRKLTINGMSCGHCVMHVENALNKLEDVSKVKVRIGKASIETTQDFNTELLSKAISEAGYELVEVK